MGLRGTGICVAAAYLVAYALRWVFIALPPGVGLCVYIVAPVIALALVTPHARSLLAYIFAAEAPAQAAVTRPASFIPFSNQVFVCLVLFRFVYGYVLTFGEIERVPLLTGFTVAPLVALLLVMVLEKGALNPDHLFPAAVLCIVAGFLALSADGRNSSLIVNTLLSSGVGFFEILLLSLFVVLSSKNRANALVIFSWVYALNSLATLVGANFGRFTNRYYEVDSVVTSFLGAAVVLVFVAYILIVLKDFSFKRTVEGVENIEPAAAVSAPDSARQIEGGCEALGLRYDLTAREREVFYLLARGRNSKVIQEELHISYNTAKAHVRHIYTKLGVHTQQELIDLVEHSSA
jgi:DNA-binding CsgD family transcriptional regulator